MPDTYAYKVRDRGGNLISGTLVADSEGLVLQRLREQGLTPLEIGKQGRSFNIELTKKKVKLRGKIKSAMTYPIAVVALVSLIMAAMLLFVVPQFKSIYSQLGGSLPMPTRVLLMVSDIFKKFWFIVIGGIFVGRFFLRRWKATPGGRETID